MVATVAPRRDSLPTSVQLQRQLEQGRTIHVGSHGEAVREAQQLLKAHGFDPGRVDGDMGTKTRAAVEAFQRSRGITVDGVIGRETLRELRTPTTGVDSRRGVDRGLDAGRDRIPGQTGADFQRRAEADAARRQRETGRTEQTGDSRVNENGDVRIAPKNMSEREKWDHYAAIVRKNGGQVCADGKPTVLGIRGMDVNGNRHESTNNRKYDDTFVVLTPDHKVLELRGATHAGQTTTSLVDHVGRINPGNYVARPNGDHNGMPSLHVTTQGGSGNIPGVRDRNDDGRYSADEKSRSRQRGDTLSAILFHVGFENSPKSIGCQTLPPAEMRKLLRAAGRGFSFSLVEA
jgi:hypothetical protein